MLNRLKIFLALTALAAPFSLPASSVQDSPQSEQPVRVCGAEHADKKNCADKPPKPISAIRPRISINPDDKSKPKKFQGSVVVEFVVGTDGYAHESHLVRSSGRDDIDAAALEAVKQSRFEPGQQHHKPVATWVLVDVSFNGH